MKKRFQEILKTNISRLKQMRESPEFKFDEKQLKTEQHWMYWRKETYGLRTPKRFKITNYGPAIEGKAFHLMKNHTVKLISRRVQDLYYSL